MTAAIRISILLFYHRIFVTPGARLHSSLNWVIKVLMLLQIVYVVVYSILPGFICRPLYMAWHPLKRQLYFNDWYYYHIQVALYSTSMAFDIILLFLPVHPVWQLQMPLKRRASVCVIFMLGAAASIVAAYKLAIFVIEMARYTDINPEWLQYEMSTLIPPQFDTYGRTFWIPSQVEPTVALIGTSLPALRQCLTSAARSMSKVWSQYSSASASQPKKGSGIGGGAVRWTSPHSRALNSSELKVIRGSNDSDVALHTEQNEWKDGAMT